MKKIITLLPLLLTLIFGYSQKKQFGNIKKNKKGIISSVKFSSKLEKNKIPLSANNFFKNYLEVSVNDNFRKTKHQSKKKEYIHDHFDQYYKNIKVDGGGYNFHYNNGRMFFANGNYIKVKNINVKPSISEQNAINLFVKHKKIEEKVVNSVTDLLIKEIKDETNKTSSKALLVYRVYLESDDFNNTEVGYINAHTGKVEMTEPRLTHATGTFATRYSGTRQAQTSPTTGGYRLFDNTRGANIHTKSLQNTSTTISSAVELIDNDNNWTAAEHSGNNNNMGLDVHWELQKIYDYLKNTYNINSYDDSGFAINAYVRYGNSSGSRDNAFWNSTQNVLLFGQGVSRFRPLASIDVVAHEFGHGITDFQIGWGATFDQAAFNEGMSDIWGAIFEQRIRPSSTWHIGEQITLNKPYLRNIQNTNDNNAFARIADTYLSSQYNNAPNDPNSYYVRSGVFSHWFYILVNGESGTNDIGSTYSVAGIGLDLAEELIVEAVFNNYLDGTTSYPAIRTAIISAAETIFCENSKELKSVTDAWHAVGVGNKYQGSVISISGLLSVCLSGSSFNVNNLPAGAVVTWSSSSNINRSSSQGSNPCNFTANGNGVGWVQASISLSGGCNKVIRKNVTVNKIVPADLRLRNPFDNNPIYTLCRDQPTYVKAAHDNGINPTNWQWNVSGAYITYDNAYSDHSRVTLRPYSNNVTVQIRAYNSCGWSGWANVSPGIIPCGGWYFSVFPNPSNSDINVAKITNNTSSTNREEDETGEVKLELYDFNRTKVKTKIFRNINDNPKIDVKGLRKGIYILKITSKSISESHQVIVE